MVDLVGFEPTTSSMPWKRAPSCATGPLRKNQRSGAEIRTRQNNSRLLAEVSQTRRGTEVHVYDAILQFYENCENGYAEWRVIHLMNFRPTDLWRYCVLLLLLASAAAQVTSSPAPSASAPPVPYSSVSQLNLMLSQLEQVAQTMQVNLAKLRIEKWKTDSNTKRGSQADVESIQRNLQMALPEIVGQLRASPENIAATFKLYRNLDELYDVFGPVVESAGAFGSKDEFQAMQNDFSALERSRRSLAERMETLASAKETDLTQLRAQGRDLQTAVPAVPPKKVVVDDTEPPKKPLKKKVPKPTTAATPKPSPATPAPPQPQAQHP